MSEPGLDVRCLPSYGFGSRSLMWWGTLGMMLIEGTVFAMGILMYFYLRGIAPAWPLGAPPPDLRWGVANTLLLLASLLPNWLVRRAAVREDRVSARRWLVVCMLMAVAFLALRAFEFTTLNTTWHANAYGSLVWLLMGLHTSHLITDTIDTGVLTVLLFTGPFEGKRMVDVSENALYWYFVVSSWLPIWAVVYLAPRM
jgi:heme/copper-type cytochrome/quinol oxidase subunit 3